MRGLYFRCIFIFIIFFLPRIVHSYLSEFKVCFTSKYICSFKALKIHMCAYAHDKLYKKATSCFHFQNVFNIVTGSSY